MHGKGTFMWSKGDMYEGHWRAGKMHGHGVKKMGNGDVYEGESRSLACLASVLLLDACVPAFFLFSPIARVCFVCCFVLCVEIELGHRPPSCLFCCHSLPRVVLCVCFLYTCCMCLFVFFLGLYLVASPLFGHQKQRSLLFVERESKARKLIVTTSMIWWLLCRRYLFCFML